MGILTAGFEMIFEKYELESLLGQGKNFWQAFCKQGLSEAVGEGATEVANILADVAVMAEKSNWRQNINRYLAENPGWDYSKAEKQAFIDALLQVGEASFGGWISGSTMGGGYSVIQNIADNVQKNQQAYNLYGQVQQELVTEALELNSNNAYAQKLQGKLDSDKQLSGAQLRKLVAQNEAVIQKQDTQNAPTSQSDKVNQNTTARNGGQLNATVQTANNQVNAAITPEDVTNMLKSKRVDTKTATGITDAIVASLNGQELTKTQSERLSSALDSPTVRSVISELMKKKADGIDSTLKNAYDEINTIGGNKNGRETALWDLQNQRADGSLPGSQDQARAAIGDGSGVSGTLREDGSSPHETLPAARRGLTSDIDAFSDDDYATVTEGSALYQVQNAFREEYGVECYIIKESSWTRSSPAYSRDGVVYIREGIDLGTLSTAVPHEATHVMKQQNFQPYVDFISCTPDALNLQSATIERLLGVVAKHKKIDPFDASPQQLFSFYDELNAVVYGLYKSGVLDSNEFDYHEYIPGAFHDFTSYIQAMDRLHEEFRNQRNASGQTKAADGGVDALMNLANEVAGVSSKDVRNTLTSQIDKVSQNPMARNLGHLNATVQATRNQANASIKQASTVGNPGNTTTNQANSAVNQADVTKSLRSKGVDSRKVDALAEAITARLNGQELTGTQSELLSFELGSPTVLSVISEFMQKKSNGIDSVKNRVYDSSDVPDGLTDEEKATLWNLAHQRVGGDRSGGSGVLREIVSMPPETFSSAQYRGVTSEVDVFGDNNYATAMGGSSHYQGQRTVSEGGLGASFTWKLRGKDVTFNDVEVQEISYVKRNYTELRTLRGQFNNTIRKAFLKDLGKNAEYLRNAGFSETDIIKIQNGRVPNRWQVHHKLPLDDSGTNSFDNLVLIQNEPYHKAITNYQNSVARQMKIGEVQAVQWPIPNGNIYPAQH